MAGQAGSSAASVRQDAPPGAPTPAHSEPSENGVHSIRSRSTTHLRPPALILVFLVLIVVLLGVGTWLLYPRPGTGLLTASGTIEYDEETLAAQATGRIAELYVDEGSQVSAGQVVGHLVDPVLNVQARQATTDPATQQLTQAQLSRLDLSAPETGIVQKLLLHKGEFVSAGGPVLTVADPTNLKLTVYVLESDLGRVALGQTVSIRADAFPNRTFVGVVTTIADRAEFTPRNVQTQRDRQNLVFAVTVRVPNADRALKAGLPVDATFGDVPAT